MDSHSPPSFPTLSNKMTDLGTVGVHALFTETTTIAESSPHGTVVSATCFCVTMESHHVTVS